MGVGVTQQSERRLVHVASGAMEGWSDFGRSIPPTGGPALRYLVGQVTAGAEHTLVVGVHEWELVDVVVAHADRTTILLRGGIDAHAAAQRYQETPVSVICGDVSGLVLDTSADVLIAVDGLERTISLEIDSPTWLSVYARLGDVLAPSARLALSVDNPLSILELGATPNRGATDDDSAWRPFELRDGTRPRSFRELEDLVQTRDSMIWTLHPSPRRPSLLAHPGPIPGALLVAHSASSGLKVDPQVVLREALVAGVADQLAGGWLVTRGVPATAPVLGLVADMAHGVSEVIRSEDGFERRLVASGPVVTAPEGWAIDPSAAQVRLGDEEVLETVLLEACGRRDHGALRELIVRTAESLRAMTPAELGVIAAATVDTVLVRSDGSLAALDATWSYTLPVSADGIAVQLFDEFAERLFGLGWRHPWPAAADSTEVGLLMSAMAGITADRATAVQHRQRRLMVESARARRREPAPAYAHDALALRTGVDLALRSKIRWFERALTDRDAEVARLRRVTSDGVQAEQRSHINRLEGELATIRSSTSLRVGRAITRPMRSLRARFSSSRRRPRAAPQLDRDAPGELPP